MEEKIFDFVYEFALRDATLRAAYKGPLDPLRANTEAKRCVRAYIEAVFRREADEKRFWETAEQVEAAFSGAEKCFTFGNTQKLINMTAKYFYIACYHNAGLRSCFDACHCPMDGIMVEQVIQEIKALSPAETEPIRSLTSYGWISRLREPGWSRIRSSDPSHYRTFQTLVRFLADREGVSPLEYDYLKWGAQGAE